MTFIDSELSTVETLLTHTYRERPYSMGFRRIWVT